MKKYKQLNYEDRISIRYGLFKKMSIREISRMLGRSPSTISREIKRGISLDGTYFAESTQRLINKRKLNDKRFRKGKIPIVHEYIKKKLKDKQSPRQIQNHILEGTGYYLGKDAIYDHIYKTGIELTELLTRKHKRKQKRKGKKVEKHLIPNRIDIDYRPIEADMRLEFGHFEADTIVSCKGSKSALLVVVDRLSRRTKIKKPERKLADLTSSSIVVALSEYNITHLHTITYDNGCEFVEHEKVNKILQMKSYFCKPFHSWEKGMVENINGLIRRWFPKGTNFDFVSEDEIQKVEDWINNREFEVLNWLTPNQVYENLLQSVAV